MEIKDRIDKAIIEDSKKEKKERKYLYASDIFQCQRKILLEYNGMAQEFDAVTLRVFDMGHSVQARIEKYLKLAGYEIETEINIPVNEHNIHGRLDIKTLEEGEPKIIEVKSIKNFNGLKDYENNSKELCPKREHKAQLTLYLKYMNVLKGNILYESKETQEIMVFPIEFDSKFWDEIEKWIIDTNLLMKDNKIPPIPPNFKKTGYPCSWCSFQSKCWGDEVIIK